MNTKKLLKNIKLNESTISLILGVLILFTIGFLAVDYFKGKDRGDISTSTNTESSLNQNEYVVQAGDTLWSISEEKLEDGFRWKEIAEENNISNPSELEKGQKLTIPSNEVNPTVVAEGENNTEKDTYTVQSGDTLWSIAVSAYNDGYKWPEIAKANNLVNPGIIHKGNVLKLPKLE